MEERIPKRAHRVAHVETYEVTSDELDTIEHGYTSRQNDLNFLSISVSVFVSFLLNIFTVLRHETGSTWMHQFYWAVTVTSGAASIYLAVRWYRSRRFEKPFFERIRARAIGPLGEEGKEIKPVELETLPSGEPGPRKD